MAKFEKDFHLKMAEIGYSVTYYDNNTNILKYECPGTTNIYLGYYNPNGNITNISNYDNLIMLAKTIRIPSKKLVTVLYILEKINKDSIYLNFSNDFKILLEKSGYTNGISVYPTSYGIGIFVLFNPYQKTIKTDIDKLLIKYQITYSNEFSNAGWVYRYKISKKASNIEKMQNILK